MLTFAIPTTPPSSLFIISNSGRNCQHKSLHLQPISDCRPLAGLSQGELSEIQNYQIAREALAIF
jgi:hypothetical protein